MVDVTVGVLPHHPTHEHLVRNELMDNLKAYDCNALDEDLDDECIEIIAPHRSNRKPQNNT